MKNKKDSKEILDGIKNNIEGHYKKNEKKIKNVNKKLDKIILENSRGKNNGN